MPVRREQVAAALKYLGDKADVKRRYERLTSLDQPQDSDAIDMALEMGGSLVPGVGPAFAARDFERARRANDPAGMAMAGASAFPLGRLTGALKQYDPTMMKMGDVINARQTRAGRNLPDLEADLAAKNLTIQPNQKGGFDVYGRKVGFDPTIPQKLATVKQGGKAAAIQAAKNISRRADVELQTMRTRNPFDAYAEFGNLDDYIADRPELLEKLMRKKVVNVEPEIESIQPAFKNKNFRVRFKTGEEFGVENIKPETLDELKTTVRKDLYNEQIPEQLQGKTVKDLISTLAWQERSEKYIKDVLSGKKRLKLED